MKPAPFRYSAPVSVAAATALLAKLEVDGKLLGGGQSLVRAMNFRLARPGHLVDINRIAVLDYVRVEQSRPIIGGLARHARFERALAPYELITEERLPLLDDAWRAGDYAIVMAVVEVRLVGSRIAESRIGLGGVIDRPVRATEAEAALKRAARDGVATTAEAAAASVEPFEDVDASADYKHDLIVVLVHWVLYGARAS